jgi:DNA-binding XRE family transcriptional regulator
MDHGKHKKQNSLVLYRRRMGFSQKTVSMLLGHKDATLLCMYDRGRMLPPLAAALALGIILRVPVEFLFPKFYDDLKSHIRHQEELQAASK